MGNHRKSFLKSHGVVQYLNVGVLQKLVLIKIWTSHVIKNMMPLPKPTFAKLSASLDLPIRERDDMIKSMSDTMLNFTVDTVSDIVETIDQVDDE